jgi:imidazolonepropionase-like amidohydrolase
MPQLVFRNANLIDGNGPVRPGVSVLVDGDRISAVETGAVSVAAPVDIDLRGRTLMPGLVTGHFHSAYSRTGDHVLPLDAPVTQQAFWAHANAMTALRVGYTSVVGAGTFFDIDATMAAAIDCGVLPGPRLTPCSRALSPGAVGDEGNDEGLCLIADGPDAFRDAALLEIERGARLIKLFASPGHAILGIRPMTAAEIAAVVAVARDHGVRTRAHVAGRDAVLQCVRLGVEIIDHADGMDEACVEAFLKHDCFVLPSLYMPSLVARDKNVAGADWFDDAEYEHMRVRLAAAAAAGVRFVPGDDYGFGALPHGSYSAELACYVEDCGVAPLEVIRWATRNGGALTGLPDLGTIAPGQLADLLVVDGDPSQDIRVLMQPERLLAVFKGGQLASGSIGSLASRAD